MDRTCKRSMADDVVKDKEEQGEKRPEGENISLPLVINTYI